MRLCSGLALFAVGTARTFAADCVATGSGPNALANAAANLQPGAWCQFTTTNLESALSSYYVIENYTGGSQGSGSQLSEAQGAVWDPTSKQVLFVGADHITNPDGHILRYMGFVTYSATTNSWTNRWKGPLVGLAIQGLPSWVQTGVHHGYDYNTIDPVNGRLYIRHPYAGQTCWQYDIAADAWSQLPALAPNSLGNCCGGNAYFPELNGLVLVQGNRVWLHANGSWTMLTPSALTMGTYRHFAEYNPVHRVVLLGGGSNLYKLDANRNVTALRNAPTPLGTINAGSNKTGAIVTVDPVSGAHLVFGHDGSFWVYDVVSDQWTRQPGSGFFEPTTHAAFIFQVVATPISTYGVTMFIKYYPNQSRVYLYRHATSPPIDTPPAAPANLRPQ